MGDNGWRCVGAAMLKAITYACTFMISILRNIYYECVCVCVCGNRLEVFMPQGRIHTQILYNSICWYLPILVNKYFVK